MGIGIRIYLVNDDDTLKRFPLARFERLFRQDEKERLPEYADQRIRYVFAAVHLVKRKPVNLLWLEFNYLALDSEGRYDEQELRDRRSTGADMSWFPEDRDRQDKVIDAQHLFARRRYKAKHNWEPTPEIEMAVFDAILES